MWYENLGFRVDRDLKSAMQADDLDAIKKLLEPSKDPEEVSLNSLLPKAMSKGVICFSHQDSLLEFFNLSCEEREEAKVAFKNYLVESIDIIVNLVDYLVRKGADVNAIISYTEHGIKTAPCSGYFGADVEQYCHLWESLDRNLYIPLAVAQLNFQDTMITPIYQRRNDPELVTNKVKKAKWSLVADVREQNDNLQIKLLQKIVDSGVDLDEPLITKDGKEVNFLDLINVYPEAGYYEQQMTLLTFYKLQKSKDLKQILDAFKFIYTEAFPKSLLKGRPKICSVLEGLIKEKTEQMYIMAQSKLAFDSTKSSDSPIGYIAAFLNLKELVDVATLTTGKHDDLSLKSIGEALENVSSGIADAT